MPFTITCRPIVAAARMFVVLVVTLGFSRVAQAQPTPPTTAPTLAEGRPNFLIILADDCTYTDLGVYGGQATTPNLERLAQQGMLFERCFQSTPMCSPTRASLLTGQCPVKTGAYPNHTFVKPGVESVATWLRRAGYRTALSGKSHLSPDDAFPFERSVQQARGTNPDFDAIKQFFEECARDQTPFLMVVASNEPHSPWNNGDPSRYPPESLTLPPIWIDTPRTRRQYSRYLAEVSFFDEHVGRAVRALDERGLAANTVVMVLSEQGNSFPFAKWTCYEPGVASAMIVRYPERVTAGSRTRAMVEYVDVVPTFLDLAGVAQPQVIDGRSFKNVLLGSATEHKKYAFSLQTSRGIIAGPEHYGIRSVRGERYRLIVNLAPDATFRNIETEAPLFREWKELHPDADQVVRYQHRPAIELFDAEADPWNVRNLANDPAMKPVIDELRAQLDAWMESQGDRGQATEMEALEHQVGRTVEE